RWKSAADGGREEPLLKVRVCGEDIAIRYQEQHMLRLQVLVQGLEASSGLAIGHTRRTVPSSPAAATPPARAHNPLAPQPASVNDGHTVPCPYCGAQVGSRRIDNHKRSKCPKRPG